MRHFSSYHTEQSQQVISINRSALEAQACGCVPVTCELAALMETVTDGGIKIPGYADNLDFQRRWVDALEQINSDPIRADLYREAGYQFVQDFTWDNQYDKWRDMLAAGR